MKRVMFILFSCFICPIPIQSNDTTLAIEKAIDEIIAQKNLKQNLKEIMLICSNKLDQIKITDIAQWHEKLELLNIKIKSSINSSINTLDTLQNKIQKNILENTEKNFFTKISSALFMTLDYYHDFNFLLFGIFDDDYKENNNDFYEDKKAELLKKLQTLQDQKETVTAIEKKFKSILSRHEQIVTYQSAIKRYLAYQDLKKKSRSIVVLQSFLRGTYEAKKFKTIDLTSIKRQRALKNLVQNKNYFS